MHSSTLSESAVRARDLGSTTKSDADPVKPEGGPDPAMFLFGTRTAQRSAKTSHLTALPLPQLATGRLVVVFDEAANAQTWPELLLLAERPAARSLTTTHTVEDLLQGPLSRRGTQR